MTISGDDISGANPNWAEVKIEFLDAGGGIINGPFGTVLGEFHNGGADPVDAWTQYGGSLVAPAGTVTAGATNDLLTAR